jgi:hypothetical protein
MEAAREQGILLGRLQKSKESLDHRIDPASANLCNAARFKT